MKKFVLFGAAAIAGVALLSGFVQETVQAQQEETQPAAPVVFQAAGPTVASIQSMVDAFRVALGGANNGNTAGPLAGGRREINWDGGGSTATAVVPTPFDGFLLTRGSRFLTDGSGFVQAPLGGLATTFNNPTYATIFQAFSPVRLFSPIESNRTATAFFVPGGGELPATTTGFGAIFSDVDRQDVNRGRDREEGSTTLSFFDARGRLLHVAGVPASKGDASLSFVGVRFDDARIAFVLVTSGNVAPGPNDSARRDVVMMDDFIYGEPQPIQDPSALTAVEKLGKK